MKLCIFLSILLTAFAKSCGVMTEEEYRRVAYHFDEPASMWEETSPLGNGRIGMMPDGGIDSETIVLNEISMWSGSKQDTDNPQAGWALPAIRRLLFEGRNDEAQELMYRTFVCKGEGSGRGHGANVPYGSYQLLGNLVLDYTYPNSNGQVSDYCRMLNLSKAVATTTYRKGKIDYKREAFTSFAGDLGIIRLTANQDNAIHFSLRMNRPEHYSFVMKENDLVMQGQLPDGVDTVTMRGTRYMARVRVLLPLGGKLTAGDSTLTVEKAGEAILLVAMATDYKNPDYETHLQHLLDEAEKKSYNQLKKEHEENYSQLFDRVELDLGRSERDEWPIDKRLYAFQQDQNDPSLPALYFQFGRYLLISSTRVGSLPPNLQGLWCNTIDTPWNGDYHLNINFQMNHWPAEVGNLSELHLPMTEWIKEQVPSGERTAKVFYNARGWVTHILGNLWEFTAPGEHPSWGATNTSAAWLCEHLYTHYLYTLDEAYLREVYPVMKGAALFFVDMLIKDPRNNYLVTAPTTSPENAFKMANGKSVYISAGSTMDNQIVRELFTNTIEAASILGIDSAFAQELAKKRAGLMPTTIGKDGRIQEWLEPYEEVEPTHRHVSHLYGLYPGNEISMALTPELAEAARKTLEVRGDKSTGWSMAWKINFWARLHDGDHAFKLLTDLLLPCVEKETNMVNGGGTYPNLFCAHPPFQIDGNFGGCAGIAEMLVQSQTGIIELLPALPTKWATGRFKGLKVQKGGELAAKWENSQLQEVVLQATAAATFRLSLPANSSQMRIELNKQKISLPVVDNLLTVEMKKGDSLVLLF